MGDTLAAGTRVKHATRTDWGLGEVLNEAQNGRATVYFEDVGVKEFDLSAAKFTVVEGEESSSDYLTGLVAYWKKQGATTQNQRSSLTEKATFNEAVEKFLKHFPLGFDDPVFLQAEREYKDAAHELMRISLGKETMAALLGEGDSREICYRIKIIVNKTNLICPYEKIWLSNGLSTESAQKKFAYALNTLLHCEAPLKERFENFAKTLYDINAAKWPIATYFGFLHDPQNHVFLKPEATKKMARAIGREINYRPELNWLTYSSVLGLAKAIKEKLNKEDIDNLVPSDMIDVQSFIWVASSYD